MHFIGIGAQKSGTSWAYACLYDHPQVCAPIKEIHFFSRPRFSEGKEWYESHFKRCDAEKKCGEFSTSYLYSKEAPSRIKEYYPEVRLIAILRNPVTRAYSQYRNAIKAGEIAETVTFESYMESEPSVVEQGRYMEQLDRYRTLFKPEQLLVLIYEDIERNPEEFMKRIYAFLGIDTSFVSSMLHEQINVARTPKRVVVDRIMHHIAESLRKVGLDRLVWIVKKSGITDFIRSLNTKEGKQEKKKTYDAKALAYYFTDDARLLGTFLSRDLVAEWKLE